MKYTKLLSLEQELHEKYREYQNTRTETLQQARRLSHQGLPAEAALLLEKYLEDINDDPEAWYELGLIYRRQRRYANAFTCLLKSLQQNSSDIRAHYEIGFLFGKLENSLSGIAHYLRTLSPELATDDFHQDDGFLTPDKLLTTASDACRDRYKGNRGSRYPNWMRFRACILIAQHRLTEAAELFSQLTEVDAENPATYKSLATILQITGDSIQASRMRGHAAYFNGDAKHAIREYQHLLEGHGADATILHRLASAFNSNGQHEEALETCTAGIQLYADESELYTQMVIALQRVGRVSDALRVADRAAEKFRDRMGFLHQKYLLLPVVYETQEQIQDHRQRFTAGLRTLAQRVVGADDETDTALQGLVRPNFYLAYQGCNDTALQERYGKMVCAIMAGIYPRHAEPLPAPVILPGEKIRIGYVSANFYQHTVAKLFIGWLENHDHNQFEIYSYHLNSRTDFMTRMVSSASDVFRQLPGDVSVVCERISSDALDILVALDIGMDAIMTRISTLRLAPVQCMAWGHPVTSGLPTIDHFISSDLMEPEHAQSHYSEKLIRLPGADICVPRPAGDNAIKSRADFRLPEDALVYLSSQSIFKYLPRYDHVYAAIARQVPQSFFAFLAYPSRRLTEIFRERLLAAFSRLGMNGDSRVMFVPRQSNAGFLSLNTAADVLLDSIGWSGGMTTLDALGCGLPVVTHPGKYMRGRHAYAFLKQMAIEEMIASDLDEYIDIAVGLGLNESWRKEISHKITDRSDLLFDNQVCVTALEDFYRSVVKSTVKTGRA